jgi:hypothetical protein
MCLGSTMSLVVNDRRGFRVSMLRHNRVALAWGIGAVFFFWMALSAFTGDTHQVCVGGGGVSQGAPGGECYEWETVAGPPDWREGVWFAAVPVGLTFMFGYAAVQTWKRESRAR